MGTLLLPQWDLEMVQSVLQKTPFEDKNYEFDVAVTVFTPIKPAMKVALLVHCNEPGLKNGKEWTPDLNLVFLPNVLWVVHSRCLGRHFSAIWNNSTCCMVTTSVGYSQRDSLPSLSKLQPTSSNQSLVSFKESKKLQWSTHSYYSELEGSFNAKLFLTQGIPE